MKKHLISAAIVLLLSLAFGQESHAQYDTTKVVKMHVVIKNDGTEFMGRILSQDAREVLINTDKLGDVIIPKHEIKEIKELKPGDVNRSGEYVAAELFATRYFYTTNGLSIKKGENYIQWNLFGPDIQFGMADNFTLGVMTSWIAIPIIGTAKYSFELTDQVHLGVGTLLGTGSWINPGFGFALPFGALTIGDDKVNINLMGGYASVFGNGSSSGGTAVYSVGGLLKASKKVSVVFDSFIFPRQTGASGGAILIPGVRVQTDKNKAFQFGFGGVISGKEALPIPIPMVQWYRKI
jgi:hypothetical protein